MYLPLIKKIRDRYISFSPWVSFSLNGQKGETAGDFFIGGDELSFGSIMSDKKYGVLQTEKGLSTSFGIDYEVDFGSDNRLAVSFGGFRSGGTTYNQKANSGLTSRKSSYFGRFDLRNHGKSSLLGNALFSDSGNLLLGNLKNNFSQKKLKILTDYEFVSSESDARLSENIENVNLKASYDFLDKSFKFKWPF